MERLPVFGSVTRIVKESALARRILGLCWHVTGIVVCYLLAFYLRFESRMPNLYRQKMEDTLPLVLICCAFFVLAFRLYRGLWSYVSFRDCLRYAWVHLLGVSSATAMVYVFLDNSFEQFPRTVFGIFYLLLVAWEIAGRSVIRLARDLRLQWRERWLQGDSTVVFGDPAVSDQFIRSLAHTRTGWGSIAAIVCDDERSSRSTLHGLPVTGSVEEAGEVVKEAGAERVLFLPPFSAPKEIKRITALIRKANVFPEYRVLPSLNDIAEGKVDVASVKRVDIEDLLNREPNTFDRSIVGRILRGKSVMVTGAGGSIGSEICRQVLSYEPARLVLFDHAEYGLFEICQELEPIKAGCRLFARMGDVKSKPDVEMAIELAEVDVIYHAAAYKHVHLGEQNVPAMFLNNVVGSANMAEVANQAGVKHFVLVSTDKAVRPTSMMGASKRLAERVIMDSPVRSTAFKAVRFGNVLGSSGSVIPIFRRQIANGGPVTVTSPNVTRFFMTIPEAVELVLMSGAIGEDRHIMVLEMGEPVKIDQMARQMIELSGWVPDRDIEIRYTGLRPGEKEYEELLTEDEDVVRTDYDKIWVMRQRGDEPPRTPVDVGRVREMALANDSVGLREMARRLIREHKLS